MTRKKASFSFRQIFIIKLLLKTFLRAVPLRFDACQVPTLDRRLVERDRLVEHGVHRRDTFHVPGGDVAATTSGQRAEERSEELGC